MPTEIFPSIVELVGSSPPTERVRAAIARVASNADPVLISAEAGLDATAVARTIHQTSGRAAGPFIALDCAAHDTSALEQEMIGRGAFGGSLMLENLEALPTSLQARLARVLRDGQIDVDDATGRGVAFDVRMMATTESTLDADVTDGTFRRELYARFTQRIELPPLRHRPADIPTLIGCLVGESSVAAGVPVPTFSREALTLLAALPWRRNVAELREVLDVLVLGAVGGTVRLEDVLGHVPVERVSATPGASASLREARMSFERQYIASVLHRHRGRMEDAARSLGIQRTNLYRKVRQLGLVRIKP